MLPLRCCISNELTGRFMSNGTKWFDTLILLVLENHGWSQVQNTEFFKWFSQTGAVFSSWNAVYHPSGPNYRSLISGNYWSCNEFDGIHRPNPGDLVPCYVEAFKGHPAERHNPFADLRSEKLQTEASLSTFQGIFYRGMDDQNDAHSGPDALSRADGNVMHAVSSVAPSSMNGRYLIFLVFDEAYGVEYSSNHVFAAMAGSMITTPRIVHSAMTHYNFARLLYDNWNVEAPPEMVPQGNTYSGQPLWQLP